MSFMEKLARKREEERYVSVGPDTEYRKIPYVLRLKNQSSPYRLRYGYTAVPIKEFNGAIICATKNIACAYKFNLGFYLAEGPQGLWALQESVHAARSMAPDVPTILDGKFGDTGLSAAQYAKFAFEKLGVDAVTVNPLGGRVDGIDAFLEYKDKGIFVWCLGSNEGSEEFQAVLFRIIASRVENYWNTNGNCGLVVGATNPSKLKIARALAGDMPILIPGIGVQGGDLEESVKAAIYEDSETGKKSFPAIINSSRGIIYASDGEDFAEAARRKVLEMNRTIRKALKEAGA